MRAQLQDRLRGQLEINNSDKGVVFVSLSAQTPSRGRGEVVAFTIKYQPPTNSPLFEV